jgi:hypothetical protein
MAPRKIVDAKADDKGNITQVKLAGNSNFTGLEAAMRMADQGKIEGAHSVRPKSDIKDYLRTNRDGKKSNNLDDMAGDT